ncbi:FkbM family methyltransferase [Gimesia fumaroli]|nr:FkbM family methyltransferase [Gimesia fumaroli]
MNNHELDKKLQRLYKSINDILPTVIDFETFSLEVDKSGASIYRSEEQLLFSKNKVFNEIQQKYSPAFVIDIGANVGFSTLVFSQAFSEAQIITVEPNLNLVDFIERNCKNNGINNVQIIQKVVGENHSGYVSFLINQVMSVDSRVHGLKGDYDSLTVEETSIDQLITDLQCVKEDTIFIKIDTQGFEERVINGARKTLDDFSNYCVMMEFAPFWLMEAGTDPVLFLQKLCTSYNVCEFPSTMLYFQDTLDEIQKKTLSEADAKDFTNYTKSLRRNEKGWCDLMIFRNEE